MKKNIFLIAAYFIMQARVYSLESQPVVIVGAGLCGLTTAYQLKKQHIPSVVLEASSRIGGRVQTVQFTNGIHLEAHMEEYWERSPAYALLKELKLPLEEDVAHSSLRIGGNLYPYAGTGSREEYLGGIFSSEEKMSWMQWNSEGVRHYQELRNTFYDHKDMSEEQRRLMGISYAEYVQSLNLPFKVSEWVRVTLEPEIAVEWDQISALDGIDEMRLFYDSPNGFGEKNFHVKAGNQNFIEALAQQLDPGSIITNAQVTRIAQDSREVRIRYLYMGHLYKELKAEKVAVTVPLYQISRIQFVPDFNELQKKAIRTLKYGSYVKAHLAFDSQARHLWEKDSKSVLTLLSDSSVGSIYEATSGQNQNDSKESWLTLLIHAQWAKKLLNLSANEIKEQCLKGLEALFPGLRLYYRDAEIFVYPTAVAYWPFTEHRSRFDELSNSLRKPMGRIWIGGDTTEDSHSEGAILAALRMSSEISKP